jgi:hypothetical protein
MSSPATNACMIGDRYLASAAAVASSPWGPVDALDTRSGRAAQVRVLFTGPGWNEEALAGAVSRWCSLGVSEACGVLDFGAHGDRWFLVVPPSLGMPLERWRMVRRPSALDAARLTLAFGRVLERVARAGFPADGLAMLDLAVGPGPTPFLERPLLGDPGAGPAGDPRAGQRSLAAIVTAAHFGELEGGLARWRDEARSESFGSLPACLDALEATVAEIGAAPSGLDAELAGLFDEDDLRLESLLPPAGERRGLRRAGAAVGIVLALLAAWAVLGVGAEGSPPTAPDAPPAADPVPVDPGTLVNASDPPPSRHAHRRDVPAGRRTHSGRPAAVRHHHRPAAVKHAATPTAPAPATGGGTGTTAPPPPAPPASPLPSGGGGATLPDPGGVTTLPPPAP